MESLPQKVLTPARINPNNEIKISQDTDVHSAIDFICDLFTNKKYETIKILGLSNAIKKVILIVEVVKSKIEGLYQINEIGGFRGKTMKDKTTDTEIFMEDQFVPRIEILLTLIPPSEEEKKLAGYQEPSDYSKHNEIMLNTKEYIEKEEDEK